MAHSRPDGIANKGDALRATTAAGYFIIELLTDPRVNALYTQWRQTRATAAQMFEAELARARAKSYPNQAAADAVVAELEDRIRQFDATEYAAAEDYVRAALQLSKELPGSERWVAGSLLVGFRTRVYNEAHPDNPRQFSIPVYLQKGAPMGKGPAHGGKDLERNVRWFYRVHVKQPPDTIHGIEREYRSWANRSTDSRSVVQNGLDQVRALLNLVTQRAIYVPPKK